MIRPRVGEITNWCQTKGAMCVNKMMETKKVEESMRVAMEEIPKQELLELCSRAHQLCKCVDTHKLV
jgi:hypothetical protein